MRDDRVEHIPHRVVLDAERDGACGRHGIWSAGSGEVDEPDSITKTRGRLSGRLDGQAGLADTPRPGHRYEPVLDDALDEHAELVVSPDEARQPRREPVGRCDDGVWRRSAGSSTTIDRSSPINAAAWVEPQLVQHVACPSKRAERFGPAAIAMQRQRQLSPSTLAQRLVRHRRLQLRDRRHRAHPSPAGRRRGPRPRSGRPPRVAPLRQRPMPPARSGTGDPRQSPRADGQHLDRLGWVAVRQSLPSCGCEVLEAMGVDAVRVDLQPVSRPRRAVRRPRALIDAAGTPGSATS